MGNFRFIRLKAKYLTSGQKGLTELPESQLNSSRDISLRMNNGINVVNWNLISICRMPRDRELQISRSKKKSVMLQLQFLVLCTYPSSFTSPLVLLTGTLAPHDLPNDTTSVCLVTFVQVCSWVHKLGMDSCLLSPHFAYSFALLDRQRLQSRS